MDDQQTNLLLNWTYLHQQKSMEELKMRDEEILHLRKLLNAAIKERDEAQQRYHNLFMEKALLHQSTPHSSIEDDLRRGIDGFSSSDCDESIVSSPAEAEQDFPVAINRPLPEKGKLLQAVMKAGPLLQTLLLAGPLPQWRHPPPALDAYQIPAPPVAVPPPSLPTVSTQFLQQDSLHKCGRIITRKRGLPESSDSTINEFKYQRVVLQ